MKKAIITIADHTIGILAYLIYYSIAIVLFVISSTYLFISKTISK